MTGSGETHLAMARRHVVEGETRVTQQTTLVARLREQGHATTMAEDLLSEFKATLADMREHLQALQIERDAPRGSGARRSGWMRNPEDH